MASELQKNRRRRAAMLLGQLNPVALVASEVGVTPATIYNWQKDPDFQDMVEIQQLKVQTAAERNRTKVLLDLDNLIDNASAIASDTGNRDQASMIRWLVDKVLPTVNVAQVENHHHIHGEVWHQLDSRLEKIVELRAATPSEPRLLEGPAVEDIYGLKADVAAGRQRDSAPATTTVPVPDTSGSTSDHSDESPFQLPLPLSGAHAQED